MPTYEYECSNCNNTFEFIHKSYESVNMCPKCGGNLKRLFPSKVVTISSKVSDPYKKNCLLEREGSTCCGAENSCGGCGERHGRFA